MRFVSPFSALVAYPILCNQLDRPANDAPLHSSTACSNLTEVDKNELLGDSPVVMVGAGSDARAFNSCRGRSGGRRTVATAARR